MKKLILPVVAMLLCMTACKKEENGILRLEVEHYNSDAKMHIDNDDFSVWDNNDVVYLNGQATAVRINGTTATIAVPTGVSAPYYASYPYQTTSGSSGYTITMPSVQTYRTKNGQQIVDAPMAAYSEDGQELKFRNIGSVLALEVKPSSTVTVTNIEVSANQPLWGKITFQSDLNSDSYTLSSCTNGGNIVTLMGINESVTSSGKVYYIALPEVSGAQFTVKVYTQGGDYYYRYTRTQSGTVSFGRNTIHTVPLTLSNATFACVDLFAVSSSRNVTFAQGNVYYNYNATHGWNMFADPWSNISSTSLTKNYCDRFGWSSDEGNYGRTIYDGYSGYLGAKSTSTFSNWGNAGMYYWGSAYRTLTADEWLYVFNTRTNTVTFNGENKGTLCWRRATVAGVAGVILFPNGDVSINVLDKSLSATNSYSSDVFTADEWNNSFKPMGCVFLPALGYRSGSSSNYGTLTGVGDYCRYWSSSYGSTYGTTMSTANTNATAITLSSSGSSVSSGDRARREGLPVRLVWDRN